MEITEGNKLIALFMGMDKLPPRYYNEMNPALEYFGKKDSHNYSNVVNEMELNYHSHWDWLMPVVEKIESLKSVDGRGEVNYIVTIEESYCVVSQGGENSIVEVIGDDKIESVWLTVVDFIQWYNTASKAESKTKEE